MKTLHVMTSKWTILVAASFLLIGCGTYKNVGKATNGSNLYQLTVDDYPCQVWNQERVDKVMGLMPSTMMKKWEGDILKRGEQALAGIPDLYIKWMAELHKKNGFSITAEDPGFTGGVVIGGEKYPEQMYIYPRTDIVDLVMQHETGHAIMYKIKFEMTQFLEELGPIADNEHENPNINAYPQLYDIGTEAYHKEFWAEAFNSYYCSPETNGLVKKQFPKTIPLLEKYLEKPIWVQ